MHPIRQLRVFLSLLSVLPASLAQSVTITQPASNVRGWGTRVFDTAVITEHAFVKVDAGGGFYGGVTFAVRSDGSLAVWGDNAYGQCNIPGLPGGLAYVEVAAAGYYCVAARRNDGSVVAWGDNYYGQANVPALPAGAGYVQLAAGHAHMLARRSDGAAVGWGWNYYGQCNVPPLPAGTTWVQVTAGDGHSVGCTSTDRSSRGATTARGNATFPRCLRG